MGAQEGVTEGDPDARPASPNSPKALGASQEAIMISLVEKAKFYTSLCLGTTAVLSVFAFMFLIPFVVDPAITTILANYEPEPVTCISVEHVYAEGLRNCSWSSCREGCTNAAIRCHQILVNYSRIPFREWGDRDLDTVVWDVGETKFFVNTEGCGYPPRVNCSEFAKKYSYANMRKPFPCYYSRTYPETVVARYSWDDNLRHLVLSLIIPNVLFGVSIGVLSYWYCPGCGRTCNKIYAAKYPSKDDCYEDELLEVLVICPAANWETASQIRKIFGSVIELMKIYYYESNQSVYSCLLSPNA